MEAQGDAQVHGSEALMDIAVVGSICLALLGVGVGLGCEIRARTERDRINRAMSLSLRQAAIELDLTPPEAAEHGHSLSRGSICGTPARLEIGGRGRHRVSVALTVVGLPEGVGIAPRPRGRDSEMFALGGAIEAGVAAFDHQYAIYNGGVSREDLVALSKQIPRDLLRFMVECFDPLVYVRLRSKELIVDPGGPMLPWSGPESPRWRASQMDLAERWRSVKRLVKEGVERGLFRTTSAPGQVS